MTTDGDTKQVKQTLDEQPLVEGIGKRCPGCLQIHDSGDRLIVNLERRVGGEWVWWGGCADCESQQISERDREREFDQYIVEIGVRETPWGLVLDAGQVVIHDQSEQDTLD